VDRAGGKDARMVVCHSVTQTPSDQVRIRPIAPVVSGCDREHCTLRCTLVASDQPRCPRHQRTPPWKTHPRASLMVTFPTTTHSHCAEFDPGSDGFG
jgi:hypothetical protein